MPKSKKSRRKVPRSRNTPQPLRIVGIGASAGGLEAVSQLLTHLPPNTGMGFVLVQHLEPTHASMAADIFAKKTAMPVAEVRDRMRIEPNRIYVIPPNRALTIQKGILRLRARGTGDGTHFPIDAFFRSLAAEEQTRAVGIVLSGTGSDGTKGLEAIQLEGGATIAQLPASAKYTGMPQAAIAAGVADTVLSPEKIARELVKISRRPPSAFRPASKRTRAAAAIPAHDELSRIFATLGAKMHMDFSQYRKSTLKRRLARRLSMTKKKSLKEYGEYLAGNPEEAKLLAADFLINVTEFFRDPNAFQALTRKVFPKILNRKDRNGPLRVWIPGCATGEEAYSVAMALLECLDQRTGPAPIQVFATDLSDVAVQKARAGVYPESISANVSPQRLKRFFSKTEQGYKIQKFLRDLVLFSVHDLTRDPPFARVDLVCCRNLLIYFEPSLQKRALQVIHYALNPGGYLWLGRAESVGTLSTHFSVTDKEKKIFLRKTVHTGLQFATPLRSLVPERRQASHPLSLRNSVDRDVRRDAEHLLLSTYGPPGVLVNGEVNIVFGFGETAPFLKLSPGEASLNLFKMASPTLSSDLRIAIQQAKKAKAPVRKENLSLDDGKKRDFSMLVIPLKPDRTNKEEFFLVCFEAGRKEPVQFLETADRPGAKRSLEITLLKQRLAEAKAYQQALIVDFEAAQEELTSTNEEMQSTNEEFQSTNEELETAKEELQSANEELTTVNDELQSRNSDLGLLNNDLTNLLSTVDFAIVMVDRYCNIRRFTPMAGKLMNLIAGDVGRPLGDITAQFDVDLTSLAAEVIENVASKEMEIKDRHGRWYRLQLRPYKTADNHIDGAVVALVDIDALKRALERNQTALDYATAVANTVPLPLLVLDSDLHFRSANRSFLEKFGGLRAAVEKDIFAIFSQPGDTSLKAALNRALQNPKSVEALEIEVQPPGMRRLNLMICAKRIKWIGEAGDAVLMSIDDITERKDLLEREKDARQDAERANRIKDDFLATLSHELRTPLNSILSWSQLIQKVKYEPQKLQHGIETIEQSARTQGQLIDDLLDVSRIQSGKLALNFAEFDPSEAIAAAMESVQLMAENK
ncbi:MAG TPA: chemotaxis protein CheB, partial [Bdellovibrionota bacterium]